MVKKLDKLYLKKLEDIQRDLKQPPIIIKIRKCNLCGIKFESVGNRNCGCSKLIPIEKLNGYELL